MAPESGKLEMAIREFIMDVMSEQLLKRDRPDLGTRDQEDDGEHNRGRVTDPEHDRRLKQNRSAA